jgi:transcriptional regulator with XRE-family HTH domain
MVTDHRAFSLFLRGVLPMEFHVKLQELRKRKGLTQEELAQALYVSRTAISKWESGRGYPNIDSLKALAVFFHISIDELLSGDELLTIAQKDSRQKTNQLSSLMYGFWDICLALLLFLPFFGEGSENNIRAVSLVALSCTALYLRIIYYVIVILTILWGVAMLALQNYEAPFWSKYKTNISSLLTVSGIFVFIVSSQPYAAAFLFVIYIVKKAMTRNVSRL